MLRDVACASSSSSLQLFDGKHSHIASGFRRSVPGGFEGTARISLILFATTSASLYVCLIANDALVSLGSLVSRPCSDGFCSPCLHGAGAATRGGGRGHCKALLGGGEAERAMGYQVQYIGTHVLKPYVPYRILSASHRISRPAGPPPSTHAAALFSLLCLPCPSAAQQT